MILPAAEDRGIVVFHVWPSLAQEKRLIASFGLIAAGLALQVAMGHVLPGVAILFVGNLLLLVRGYDNRVDFQAYDPASEWERVDFQRLEELRNRHREIRQWDTSALDISNVLGAVIFIVLLAMLVVLALFTRGAIQILVIDAAVLLLPHWLTGTRTVLTLPKLMIKVELMRYLLAKHRTELAADQVQVLMLLKGSATRVPEDVKFKLDLKDAREELLGVYGQVVTNEVQGKSYPYFYVVVVARKGLELWKVASGYTPPKGVTVEAEDQDEVEVLVIRQTTTKKSGYHTDATKASFILDVGLQLARRHATTQIPGS